MALNFQNPCFGVRLLKAPAREQTTILDEAYVQNPANAVSEKDFTYNVQSLEIEEHLNGFTTATVVLAFAFADGLDFIESTAMLFNNLLAFEIGYPDTGHVSGTQILNVNEPPQVSMSPRGITITYRALGFFSYAKKLIRNKVHTYAAQQYSDGYGGALPVIASILKDYGYALEDRSTPVLTAEEYGGMPTFLTGVGILPGLLESGQTSGAFIPGVGFLPGGSFTKAKAPITKVVPVSKIASSRLFQGQEHQLEDDYSFINKLCARANSVCKYDDKKKICYIYDNNIALSSPPVCTFLLCGQPDTANKIYPVEEFVVSSSAAFQSPWVIKALNKDGNRTPSGGDKAAKTPETPSQNMTSLSTMTPNDPHATPIDYFEAVPAANGRVSMNFFSTPDDPQAELYMKHIQQRIAMLTFTATLKCPGIPDIQPSSIIKLEVSGQTQTRFSRFYQVQSIKHSLGQGFKTTLGLLTSGSIERAGEGGSSVPALDVNPFIQKNFSLLSAGRPYTEGYAILDAPPRQIPAV